MFGRGTVVIAEVLSQLIDQIFNSEEGVLLTLSRAFVECTWVVVDGLTPDPGMRIGDIVGGMVIR